MIGLFHGRLQPITTAHQQLIDFLYGRCQLVYILIGSSQKSRTDLNPFTFEERKRFVKFLYPQAVVLPAPDLGLGDNRKWGQHLIQIILDHKLALPQITISSADTKLKEIFQDWPQIETVIFPRTFESSTLLRAALAANQIKEIKTYLPEKLIDIVPEMAEIIQKSPTQDSKIKII